MDFSELIAKLNGRGFKAYAAETASDAKKLALSLIKKGETSAFGGSVTVCETLKLHEALRDRGDTVFHRSFFPDDERKRVMLAAFTADWYVSSANALTADGEIVNTDGLANRVSAQLFGGANTLFIVGKNKIVDDINAAFDRIRNVAAVKNCERLGIPESEIGDICRATTIIHRPTRLKTIHVILVNEDLGY